MATKLHKPVTREITLLDRRGKGMKVTLEPGNILTFRVKGSRRTDSIYLGHCLNLAKAMTAEEHYRKAMEKYHAKREAGGRPRKPKRPWLPFGEAYTKILTKKG